MDRLVGCLIVHDGKVQLARQHELVQFRGVVFFKLHGDVGVELLKGGQDFGQQVGAQIHGDTEGELSAAHLAVLIQLCLQALKTIQDLSGGIQVAQAEGGGNQTILGAVKDRGAKFLFNFI